MVLGLVGLLGVADALAIDDGLVSKYSSVTNFVRCNQQTRNELGNALRNAANAGDIETFGALLDLLAKDGNGVVEQGTFNIWREAANAIVNAGLAARNKSQGEQKGIMEGFREGGTTFGLWQGTEQVETIDATMLQVGRNILLNKMPQKGLSMAMVAARNEALLRIAQNAGTDSDQVAAVKEIVDFIFGVKPESEDDENAVKKAMNIVFAFLLERGKGEEYAELATKILMEKRAFLEKCGEEGMMEARVAAGWNRANKEKKYLAAVNRMGKRPITEKSLSVYQVFYNEMSYRRHPVPWDEVLRVSRSFLETYVFHCEGQRLLDAHGLAYMVYERAGEVRKAIMTMQQLQNAYAVMQQAWEGENAREKEAREKEKQMRMEKVAFTPYVRNAEIIRPNDVSVRHRAGYIRMLQENGLDDEVTKFLSSTLTLKSHQNEYWALAFSYARMGKRDEALKVCQKIQGTNIVAQPFMKFQAKQLEAYLLAKDPKELVDWLWALRPFSDAEGKEGETEVESERRFLGKIRAFSRILFSIDCTQANYAYLKALEEMTRNMLWAEEKVVYKVPYLADAPMSAEGAYYADIFKKLPTENRFAKYNCYNWFDKSADNNRVKAADKLHLAADAEGKEGYLSLAYDDLGLHVYLKLNDPEAWRARGGLESGAGFEYSIMPGEGKPWHWNMFNTAKKSVDNLVVWGSPDPDFKIAMEYVREDFVIQENCHVAHIFFPWILFSYELPKDGDIWRLSLVGGWAGQFGALGGGAVHEMGRSMQLVFDVPASALAKIRLGLLRQAVCEYRKVRTPFENAEFWCDQHLGDPAFYEEVVKPFMEEMDKVANEIALSTFDVKKVDSYLEVYLRSLSDFRQAVDAKRVDWIKTKIFAE